jgi:CSLREA domain-containing protein
MADPRTGRTLRLPLLLTLLVLAMAASATLPPAQTAFGATFTVTRTDDPAPNGCAVGDCSLREAIIDANITVAHDTIVFNIAGAGPHIIAPTSPLPFISQQLTINGFCATCSGATANTAGLTQAINAHYRIVLTGQLAGANANGLTITRLRRSGDS